MKIFSASLALVLSLPAASQWSQVNNGLATLVYGAAMHGTTPDHVFARAYNVLYRSDDLGATWSAVTNPIAGNPSDIGYFFNGRYFAGSSSITACIHYTDDAGDTWIPATGAPSATVVRGFLEYGGALYAYTSNMGIYRTTDGDSWAAVNNGLSNLNVIGMCAAGPYFLAATIGGGVYRTIFADTWTQSTGIAGGDLSGELIWHMGGSQYYRAQSGAIYRSTDLGSSFSLWTPPPQFGLAPVEVKRFGNNLYVESRHFAGGQRDSLYRTTNGSTWTNITANLNAADLNGSGILEHDGHVFIGYGMGSPGQGLYRYSLSTSIGDDVAGASALRVYPNPVDEDMTVQLPEGGTRRGYTLFDALGGQIRSGRVGEGSGRIGLEGLEPGIYFLQFEDARMGTVRVVKR